MSHDAAAAHRADADFLGVALPPYRRTVVNIVVSPVVFLVDGIGQHQGRAAGSIQLVVMVLLHDLNLIICAQDGRGTLAQFRKNVDAHRHIGTFEHRDRARKLHDPELQLLRKAGGTDHDGELVSFTVGQGLFYGCRGTEVDDDISLAVQLFQAVVNGDTVLFTLLNVNTGHNAAVIPLGDHLAQRMTHPTADSLNNDLCHLDFL